MKSNWKISCYTKFFVYNWESNKRSYFVIYNCGFILTECWIMCKNTIIVCKMKCTILKLCMTESDVWDCSPCFHSHLKYALSKSLEVSSHRGQLMCFQCAFHMFCFDGLVYSQKFISIVWTVLQATPGMLQRVNALAVRVFKDCEAKPR